MNDRMNDRENDRNQVRSKGNRHRVAFKPTVVLLAMVLLLLAVACNGRQQDAVELVGTPLAVQRLDSPLDTPESPLAQPDSPLQNLDLENPTGDQTIVIGQIVSFDDEPLKGEVVRLPDVNCPDGVTEEDKRFRCFWALDDAASPSAVTDENGIFVFDSVPAQDYVLLIGDIMNRYTVISDEAGRAIIYTAAPNDILDLGQFAVDF